VDDINPLYKSFKLAVGVLLSLVVAGYTVGVGVAGGLDNPEHPKNEKELQKVLLTFAQKTQTADELLQGFHKANSEEREWNAFIAKEIQHEINARIERQRKIAARREKVPEGHRISFGTQLEQDMAEGLGLKFPDLADIQVKSVLMQEPDAYEIIAGSTASPGDLMDYIVKVGVNQGWLVMNAMHHDGENTAFVSLMKEERVVFAAMITRDDVFENFPTIAYFGSVTEAYQGDEIPMFGVDESSAEDEWTDEEWEEEEW